MRERQYLQCLYHSQLLDLKKTYGIDEQQNGFLEGEDGPFSSFEPVNQSIPIVLPITDQQKEALQGVSKIRLSYEGKLVAVLSDPEIYPHRKEERVSRKFATNDTRHPTVKLIMESGDWLLGGDLKVSIWMATTSSAKHCHFYIMF